MTINQPMRDLLARLKIDPRGLRLTPPEQAPPILVRVKDSVFLETEYTRCPNVSLRDFPDRTGLECFINHVHVPFAGDKTSVLQALTYVAALETSIRSLEDEREFRIILSICGNSSVIRFHANREGESWLAQNLEAYQEPLAVFSQLSSTDPE